MDMLQDTDAPSCEKSTVSMLVMYGLLIRHNPDVDPWDVDVTYSDLQYVEHNDFLYVSTKDNNTTFI